MPQRRDTDAVDREAFLRAIIDRPEDDLPRLIYADWLDERGDPRGQLIRVQTELANPSCPPLRRRRLVAAETKLLKRFHAEWAESLGMAAQDVEFRRGFAEVICGTAQSIS